MSMRPFEAELPEWANKYVPASTAEEALRRGQEACGTLYALMTQTGIHALIEWCGVMREHLKMLTEARRAGVDPREVDQHHAVEIELPGYMVEYFCEKLGCQLKPFIRANPALWRRYIDGWFKD